MITLPVQGQVLQVVQVEKNKNKIKELESLENKLIVIKLSF